MTMHYQDGAGSVAVAEGLVCERLLGVYAREEGGGVHPCLFWLKAAGGDWHRFFVRSEPILLVWVAEPAPYANDLDDPADFPVFDLGARHTLHGLRVLSATMEEWGAGAAAVGRLRIAFAGGRALTVTVGADSETLEISA